MTSPSCIKCDQLPSRSMNTSNRQFREVFRVCHTQRWNAGIKKPAYGLVTSIFCEEYVIVHHSKAVTKCQISLCEGNKTSPHLVTSLAYFYTVRPLQLQFWKNQNKHRSEILVNPKCTGYTCVWSEYIKDHTEVLPTEMLELNFVYRTPMCGECRRWCHHTAWTSQARCWTSGFRTGKGHSCS